MPRSFSFCDNSRFRTLFIALKKLKSEKNENVVFSIEFDSNAVNSEVPGRGQTFAHLASGHLNLRIPSCCLCRRQNKLHFQPINLFKVFALHLRQTPTLSRFI